MHLFCKRKRTKTIFIFQPGGHTVPCTI